MAGRFRVGITRTLLAAGGKIVLAAVGLEALEADGGVDWRFLDEETPEITATQGLPQK